MYSLYHILCVPQNLVRKLCTFYKGHTQDIVFCQRLQYDENGEKASRGIVFPLDFGLEDLYAPVRF